MVDWGVLVRRRYYRFSVSPWVSIFRVAHFSSITVQLNRNLCLSYALSFALPHGFSLLDSCIQRKIQNGSMYSAHNINTIHRLYKIKAPPIRAQIHPSVRRHHRYCSDFSTKHFFGIHFLPFSKYTNTFIRLQSLCIYNTRSTDTRSQYILRWYIFPWIQTPTSSHLQAFSFSVYRLLRPVDNDIASWVLLSTLFPYHTSS